MENSAMAWLDTGEDILHLLRGTYGERAPPQPPHSEALFGLFLLLVICGILLTILIAKGSGKARALPPPDGAPSCSAN
jgi:hypothetical protein